MTYSPPTVEEARDAWQTVVDACEQHAAEAHAGDVTNDPSCEFCKELDGLSDQASYRFQEAKRRAGGDR